MKREMGLHPSINITWAIANREALLSESPVIEPVHFFLAIFEMMDYGVDDHAAEMGLPPESVAEINAMLDECRQKSGLTNAEITQKRRQLRQSLRKIDSAPPGKVLHRSDESRRLFQAAAERAANLGENMLNVVHLFRELSQRRQEGEGWDLPVRVESGGANKSEEEPKNAKSQPAGRKRTPVLDKLGRDLTELARQGKLQPVIGRKAEMTAIARHLIRTSKHNVILVGDAGVGKTAVVEGLAQRIAAQNTLEQLSSMRIVQLNVADLVAGTRYRGDLEERLQELIEEVSSDPHIVLFLDEIHLVMKSGSGGDSPMDMANILKPALGRENFHVIGATTTEEYERYIKDDPAFQRRFQLVRVKEPSLEESLLICQGWAARIEAAQHVHFSPEAVQAAVTLSHKFIRNRFLPDKAIDLLENAATYVLITSLTFKEPIGGRASTEITITPQHIQAVLEDQYGISVSTREMIDLDSIRAYILERLVGQDQAVAALLESLSAVQLRDPSLSRPLGIFLFTGPTGVGKTFLAECLARALFGEESRSLLRLNMNEYKDNYDLTRITGAAPGFIGHDRQGVLYAFTERFPQGVILLDEFEKAHPEVQDFFLQLFDKGQSIDSRGRTIDFRQYFFIMTTNVTAEPVKEQRKLGFVPAGEPQAPPPDAGLQKALNARFRPEFLGRLDRVIEFLPLTAESYRALLNLRMTGFIRALQEQREVIIQLADGVLDSLLKLIGIPADGVRGFQRIFDQAVTVPLSAFAQTASPGAVIQVGWDEEGGKITMESEKV